MLDDRRIPGSKANIDHIVVSPSGIWIVDAKNYTGKVELRVVGGWRKRETKLFVNGRDRTKLVAGMGFQHEALVAALTRADLGDIPVSLALCFTNSEWPLFGGTGRIDDVWIVHAKALIKRIMAPGTALPLDHRSVAAALERQLPAA